MPNYKQVSKRALVIQNLLRLQKLNDKYLVSDSLFQRNTRSLNTSNNWMSSNWFTTIEDLKDYSHVSAIWIRCSLNFDDL